MHIEVRPLALGPSDVHRITMQFVQSELGRTPCLTHRGRRELQLRPVEVLHWEKFVPTRLDHIESHREAARSQLMRSAWRSTSRSSDGHPLCRSILRVFVAAQAEVPVGVQALGIATLSNGLECMELFLVFWSWKSRQWISSAMEIAFHPLRSMLASAESYRSKLRFMCMKLDCKQSLSEMRRTVLPSRPVLSPARPASLA